MKAEIPVLAPSDAQLLSRVGNGANIWDRSPAMDLRRIEKETPGLIRIVKARANPPGHMQQPYFGCKLTARGKRVLENQPA